MTITVDATIENGLLKPNEPLTFPEGTKVRVTVTPADEVYDPLDAVIGICEGGRTDGADNHDKYIYGKLENKPSPAADDPLEEVIGICDDGPDISLAARHDEIIYGLMLDKERQP